MYSHETPSYKCPFCLVAKGVEGEYPLTKQADIIYRDEAILALISSHWRIGNEGHVIITPNTHIENLYEMPDELLGAIHSFSRQVALALKRAYGCDGITIRQNSEPAGDQDVWHYHLHVVPRYQNDSFQTASLFLSAPAQRLLFADKLRRELKAESN